MSNIAGNRHSTPEAANSLRPPNQRSSGSAGGHLLRASADMSGAQLPSPLSGRNIRPSSEVYTKQNAQNGGEDGADSAEQKWISDIDSFETTLDEMAAATVDQEFKDELSAIEQWFKVLTEAERTAALYALLQQTTHIQLEFFLQVLNEVKKNNPAPGIMSPTNFGGAGTYMVFVQPTALTNRILDPMNNPKLGIAGNRESIGSRPPASPGVKRNSGLPQEQINALFPDAARVIASKKAEYTQQTGNQPTSNRNSAAFGAGDRSSLTVPTGAALADANKDKAGPQSASLPWAANKTAKAQDAVSSPMGQFTQPPPSAGLRPSRPSALSQQSLHGHATSDLGMMSPAFGNGSWASMTNTPMVANFGQQPNQADMVANATAMKLAALSTVNNRVLLDDAKKYRRSRSNDGQPLSAGLPMSPGMAQPGSVLVVNEQGQLVNSALTPQQMAQIQIQQAQAHHAALLGAQNRSRPNSPGMAMRSPGMPQASPMFQNNGFLSAGYDGSNLVGGMAGMALNQYGMGGGSVSGEEERGRSPRGRRGQSKAPEDPTDLKLLENIPEWLRMLRLHKYTPNLKDMNWKDLVQLDEKGLENKGVNALGARRKMLKVSLGMQAILGQLLTLNRPLTRSRKRRTLESSDLMSEM